MGNLLNIQGLTYCKTKHSNISRCGRVATYQVKLCSRKDKTETPLEYEMSYRCEQHKLSGTNSKKVFDIKPFDQSYTLQKINDFLRSLIGKFIKSKVHTAKELEVRYLKDNGGVMCFQNITKKWKFVYYNQIEEIIRN